MEQTFWNVTGLNMLGMAIQYLEQIILTWVLLDKIPDRKKALLFSGPCCVLLATAGAAAYLNGMFTHFGGMILHCYTYAMFWCVGIHYLYKEKWKNAAAVSSVIIILTLIIEDFSGFFITRNYDLSVTSDLLTYISINWLGGLAVTACLARLLRQKNLGKAYTSFLYDEQRSKVWRLWMVLLPLIHYIMIYLVNEKKILNNGNPVVSILSFLLVYGVFNYVFRCEIQEKQIAQQNAAMQQQELYIQNLENVQREMRLFRHDYKNMMAGIYLQAEEGNMTAIQNFISRITEDFDKLTGEKISQMTQLGNIKIPELKGLLAAKLVQVQKRKIQCHLEVWEPVARISMPARDLCRVVGIILDNAMEAVEGMEKPVVTCMFISSRECTTILVKNPVSQEIPIAEIWKEGYSTKGENRGLGLTSYRRIINSYENVFSYTYEENGMFIQELKIGGGTENDTNLHM